MSDELRVENERLRAENTTLRGLMPKLNVPCVYCGLTDISKCASGFPGCAQADDLMVADDETGKRLVKENRELRAELDRVKREGEAMREALGMAHPARIWDLARQHYTVPNPGIVNCCTIYKDKACDAVDRALSPTAASDYVSKADVREIAEALRACLELMDHARGLSLPSYTALHNAQGYARAALAKARKLGVLEGER